MDKNFFDKMNYYHRCIELQSTPVAVYERLYTGEKNSFVYESLEESERRGRYSFLGGKPYLLVTARKGDIEVVCHDKKINMKGNPFTLIREYLSQIKFFAEVKPFPGGALGYVSYDGIRYFEDIPDKNYDEIDVYDLYFMFPGEIIIFDHKENIINIVIYSDSDATVRMDSLVNTIHSDPVESTLEPESQTNRDVDFSSNLSKSEFENIVKQAKKYIVQGDIFQVVLSQRLSFPVKKNPLDVYKTLRKTNPSPYMYYLDIDVCSVLGSSPEILVKCCEDEVVSRPLAGTRPRGQDQTEDLLYEQELKNDDKERAEHVMLVDLARNDLGRVCKSGSVQTTDFLEVERFSRVMHLVSHVQGELKDSCDSIDLLRATFPAGTVSGAPKIRAMEIIDELEPERRGIYSGAIGYLGFDGDMDMCIAIRMMVIKEKVGYIQAGAGIVADSIPENEYYETLNKARALLQAVTGKKEVTVQGRKQSVSKSYVGKVE
ncbi:MAG: anthranilate synthase component I [bacterium]